MLNLNYSKSKSKTFCRCNPSLYSHSIGKNALERIFLVQDPGVLFDHKHSFKDHLSTIANKAGMERLWSVGQGSLMIHTQQTIPFICFERINLGHRKSITLLSCDIAPAGLTNPEPS